jgi:hypothetical protein
MEDYFLCGNSVLNLISKNRSGLLTKVDDQSEDASGEILMMGLSLT